VAFESCTLTLGRRERHRLQSEIQKRPLNYCGHSSWKHIYGHNPIVIWRKMPARTCGRRNVSLRYQFLIDSLAPGKPRMGNHQLPSQIRHQNDFKMLEKGSSSSVSGKTEACPVRWGRRRHASFFKPGSVTFVGTLNLLRW